MRNEQVDAVFRGILAGVSPEVAPKPMTASCESSRKLLEDAADILCRNDEQRAILQNMYTIAKQDGWIEATEAALARMAAV